MKQVIIDGALLVLLQRLTMITCCFKIPLDPSITSPPMSNIIYSSDPQKTVIKQ